MPRCTMRNSTQYEVRPLYDGVEFADPLIEEMARQLILDHCGPDETMHRLYRYGARLFLKLITPLTRETLSLRTLREGFSRLNHHYVFCHLVLLFMARFKDYYAADDAEDAREVIPHLSASHDGFWHLSAEGIHSFRNLVYYHFYDRGKILHIVTDNDFVRSIAKSFLASTKWQHTTLVTQELTDFFVRTLETVVQRRGVTRPEEIDQEFFFDFIDSVRACGEASKREVGVWVGFFKHGAAHLGFSLDEGPYFNSNCLFGPALARLLNEEYTCRENVFLLKRRDKGFADVVVHVALPNPSLRPVFVRLLSEMGLSSYEYRAVQGHLITSLGPLSDPSTFTFTEERFFLQVAYFRMLYQGDERNFGFCVGALRALYVAVDYVSKGAFFRDARLLTYGVLTTPRFIEYIVRDYIISLYSPYDTVTDGIRRVFIVKGFDSYKRTLLRDDYIGIDFSVITNPFYRSLAWRCVTSTAKRLYRPGLHCVLRRLFVFLDALKKTSGYRSPDEHVFTVWDAVMVAELFDQQSKSPRAYNALVMEVKDYLRWARSSGLVSVDPVVFDVFKKKKLPHAPTNTPVISDEAITKLGAWLNGRALKESKYAQAFIILSLLILTPMRVGHVCRLRKDELQFDELLNSYVFIGISKGTQGGKGVIVLGGGTNDLIRKALELSEEIGQGCPDPGMRDYLFVCRERQHYDVFSTVRFRKIFERANAACGYSYGPANIRATYMTKAYIEASQAGRANDYVLKLFSYHRSSGTTLENYVNHDEALAALTDYLKEGNNWEKTIYPDEIMALREVIEQTKDLMENAPDEETRRLLAQDLRDYEKQLKKLSSK